MKFNWTKSKVNQVRKEANLFVFPARNHKSLNKYERCGFKLANGAELTGNFFMIKINLWLVYLINPCDINQVEF